MRIVQTKTTYLEMRSRPAQTVPPPREDVRIVKAENPSPDFYRYLYRSVGDRFHWVDRLMLSDAQLQGIIQDDRVDVYVLAVSGRTAGYAELDRRVVGEVELVYFGLFPEFTGQRLGTYFLHWTLERAWSTHPRRVWVHTCDLDHPAALPTYRKAGFVVFDQKIVDQAIPDALDDPSEEVHNLPDA